jgi:hypothetical protein
MTSVPPTAATRCPFMRRILGRGLRLLVALALHSESAAISPRFSAVVLAEWCIPCKAAPNPQAPCSDSGSGREGDQPVC